MAAERNDRLHRALAERARADDGRALLVMQRAGDDLGGGSRSAVDEHDDLLAVSLVARVGIRPLRLLLVATLGDHDGAILQEVVGHGDRLIEQSARVVAQVDDVALEILADRLLGLVDRLDEVGVRLLVEGRHLDVGDVALVVRLHWVDADDVAHHLHVEGIVNALAHDRERDRRVDGPAHLLDRLLQREPDDLLAVDVGDEVVGQQAGLGGRACRRWATRP